MLRSDQILATVEMIQKENLDVRTVTMGINILDCRTGDVQTTCERVEQRILDLAGNFVPTCNAVSRKLGIPVVNKRISVTPIAFVGAGFDRHGFVELAKHHERVTKDLSQALACAEAAPRHGDPAHRRRLERLRRRL